MWSEDASFIQKLKSQGDFGIPDGWKPDDATIRMGLDRSGWLKPDYAIIYVGPDRSVWLQL